jgi:hypothetical protein
MTTKSWKIAYWIVTVLYSLFMITTALPDVLMAEGAVIFFESLQYPAYLLPIVGWAKLLGIVGIWQRKWPFLREWAYAGLAIDTLGAFLSHLSVGHPPYIFLIALTAFVLTLVSYWLLRKAYGSTARLAAVK